MATKLKKIEKLESAAQPCLTDLPYRAVVFLRADAQGTPIYSVAGSSKAGCGAEKALIEAHRVHGGACFYCETNVEHDDVTIDHVEPRSKGGGDKIQNLLIACKPCNQKKANLAIEAFAPDAGREWLSALLRQVQDRLNRLEP